MAFLRLDGWKLPVLNESARAAYTSHGAPGVSWTGRPDKSRRQLVRRWQHDVGYLSAADADTLEALLERRCHKWGFATDAFSDSGIGPEDGGSWSIVQRLSADGGLGWAYLNVATSVVFDCRLPAAWTVAWWRVGVGTRAETHVVVRSDGAKWFNGVRNDSTPTTELTVSNGAVAFTAGNYDNLLVIPHAISDAFAAVIGRWQSGRWLNFELRLEDTPVDSRRHNAASDATVTYVRGIVSRAASFVGISDRVRFLAGNGEHAIVGKTAFSVDFWVRRDATAVSRAVISHRNAGAGWQVDVDANGALTFSVETAAGLATAVGATPLPLSTWVHVVCTWEQVSGSCSVWLNGKDDTTSRVTRPGSAPVSDAAVSLIVGNGVALATRWPGAIDEVRLHGTVLDADEIVEHYQCGLSGLRPPGVQVFASGHPGLMAFGGSTNYRQVAVCPEAASQDYQQHGGTTWVNNARMVTASIDEQFAPDALSPAPYWQWLLESSLDAAGTVRAVKGNHSGVRTGGIYSLGPVGIPGQQAWGTIAAPDNVALTSSLVANLAELKAITLLAWVRRGATGAVHTLCHLRYPGPNTKLLLTVTAANVLAVSARGSSLDALQTFTSAVAVSSTTQWSLIGCIVNLETDTLSVIKDGTVASLGVAFASTVFSAEGETSYLGNDGAGANRWVGEIGSVAIWPYALRPNQIGAIYAQGKRGVWR
jgi:hypothetical protein